LRPAEKATPGEEIAIATAGHGWLLGIDVDVARRRKRLQSHAPAGDS
jgi:hypothetical protein